MIYVFGHKNPDTDAILSSMIYQKFLEIQGVEAIAVKLGEINKETAFCLQNLGWSEPELVGSIPAGSRVALTDHNEPSQTVDNISELEIISIIDHHKFSLTTNTPLEIVAKPRASTCSVLFDMRNKSGNTIPQDVLKAMSMGIISDTLFFRSPTTTEIDKEIFATISSKLSDENLENLANAMFDAKSQIDDMTTEQIVFMDYKEFSVGEKKVGIGAVETTNPTYTLSRINEIKNILQKTKQENGLVFIMLCVVDILKETNTTIVADKDDESVIEKVFSATFAGDVCDLGNRISRKKQLAAPLSEFYSNN